MNARDKRLPARTFACIIFLVMMCVCKPCHAVSLGGTLRLSLGQQQVLDVPVPMEQVAIGDPEVVDVKIITQGRQVLVTATGKGTTDLITWVTDAVAPNPIDTSTGTPGEATFDVAAGAVKKFYRIAE